jgi:hypothetical protein
VDPPDHPDPTIRCTQSISTQFCFEECQCSCKDEQEELGCVVDANRCPDDSAELCSMYCDCVELDHTEKEDL